MGCCCLWLVSSSLSPFHDVFCSVTWAPVSPSVAAAELGTCALYCLWLVHHLAPAVYVASVSSQPPPAYLLQPGVAEWLRNMSIAFDWRLHPHFCSVPELSPVSSHLVPGKHSVPSEAVPSGKKQSSILVVVCVHWASPQVCWQWQCCAAMVSLWAVCRDTGCNGDRWGGQHISVHVCVRVCVCARMCMYLCG